MSDPLAVYRDAVAKRVHTICLDRHLDPRSQTDPEAGRRLDRLFPQLIALTSDIRSNNLGDDEDAIAARICPWCGSRDAPVSCPARERAERCLFRYLPLILDAIESVEDQEQETDDEREWVGSR